jgi:hypothetical protein
MSRAARYEIANFDADSLGIAKNRLAKIKTFLSARL